MNEQGAYRAPFSYMLIETGKVFKPWFFNPYEKD
jgi:hypothetical protein